MCHTHARFLDTVWSLRKYGKVQEIPSPTKSDPLRMASNTRLLPLWAGRWICLQILSLSWISCRTWSKRIPWMSSKSHQRILHQGIPPPLFSTKVNFQVITRLIKPNTWINQILHFCPNHACLSQTDILSILLSVWHRWLVILTSSGKSLGWGEVKRILISGSILETWSRRWAKRRPPCLVL